MNQNTENIFGTTLKVLRVKNHYTQEDVADRIHVSRQAISKWEQDKTLPDLANLVELSKLYHVKLESLIQLLDKNRNLSPEMPDNSPETSDEYIFKIPKKLGRLLLTMLLATIVALSSAIPMLGLFFVRKYFLCKPQMAYKHLVVKCYNCHLCTVRFVWYLCIPKPLAF